MLQTRPVSDLRNKFPEIETLINTGEPICLTKNGYGAMVVMNLEHYASLTGEADPAQADGASIEAKLDEADCAAAASDVRYTHEEVFCRLKKQLYG
ncbi:type II toxin-antitoxin system Phd/YefM family antitoxin [Breznakiellaceae bacterium SP9]